MTRNSKGFTLIELLIVVGIVGVLSAIATATVLNARLSGNEASAIASMRAVLSAQIAYSEFNRGFAVNISALATPCPGAQSSFLSGDLAVNGATKSGYIFTILPGAGSLAGPNDCGGVATQTEFYATATPISVGTSGRRAFASNQRGAIWQDMSGVPPVEPFTAGGTVSPLGK